GRARCRSRGGRGSRGGLLGDGLGGFLHRDGVGDSAVLRFRGGSRGGLGDGLHRCGGGCGGLGRRGGIIVISGGPHPPDDDRRDEQQHTQHGGDGCECPVVVPDLLPGLIPPVPVSILRGRCVTRILIVHIGHVLLLLPCPTLLSIVTWKQARRPPAQDKFA